MRKIVFVLTFLISSLWLIGQEGKGLTAMDIAKLQSVTDVNLSSDGRLLAFTRSVPADPLKENKPASTHLYIYDVASGKTAPFFTRSSVRNVAFRPKQETITFLTRMPGDNATALYEMSLIGGEATKLFEFKTSISSYEWAADGQNLAFRATEPKEKEKSKLPYEPVVYEENLSLTRAYLVDLEKGEPKEVMVKGNIGAIHWSPAQDKLAVMAAPSPLVDDVYMAQGVHIVDAKTLKTIAEVKHEGKKGDFAWSPNGEYLALIGAADIHDPIDGRLLVVGAKGGKTKNLAPDFPGSFDDFAWTNNNTIQFLASEGVHSVLGTVQADGSDFKKIPSPKMINISAFDRAADGALALRADSPRHPAEAFLLSSKTNNKAKRITNSNPWLEDKAMGKQEVVTYKARDGLEIQGLLIHPVGEEAGKKYPLVTVVHGGPESHYNNGWLTSYSMGGQMMAGEGYAVFYPNYRGSTGRGVEFAKTSQGDLAGKEFDDVVDGVDYLIERGLVDKDKVGVTGGSYGGYATGWMATRYTDRFAAGVMFVGISDNISKWGTSDIPEELYLVHARKRIWEDYEFFLKRSPIYYADQCKTPLLIMAGAEDTRVDPSQSMELYRHIKTRTETPVRLVLYPGEGHGNRNATARLDYSQRLMEWFDKFLKKEAARP